YMLQDIHRAWFWHVQLPWGDQPPAEASPSVEVAGERVTETWTENGLVRRTFERLDGAREGMIRIDYLGGHRTGRPASQVVLENSWFGYRLEITTTQWRELWCDGSEDAQDLGKQGEAHHHRAAATAGGPRAALGSGAAGRLRRARRRRPGLGRSSADRRAGDPPAGSLAAGPAAVGAPGRPADACAALVPGDDR